MKLTVLQGDCREKLGELPSGSVHCCVTSPPYFGLRDYGVDGQIGLEPSPDEYVAKLVEVFREVKRVLRDDGTLWLNLGDSYARMQEGNVPQSKNPNCVPPVMTGRIKNAGLKAKDLIGIPWMVAFALRADGWYLRQDIIWSKGNPMPESVTDRCTKSHEYIFMLTKSAKYYYDAEAIKEPGVTFENRPHGIVRDRIYDYDSKEKVLRPDKQRGHSRRHAGFNDRWDAMEKTEQCGGMRNKRSVWHVSPMPYPDAHFATYPPKLIKPCILAGCPPAGRRCDCNAVIDTPTGEGEIVDPSFSVGRAGMSRPRREGEGTRPITKRIQRGEAEQMRQSAERAKMREICGSAFDHYIRTDGGGARPLPESLRQDFYARGWLREVAPCDHPIEPPGVVLDPFAGSGTTGKVALELGRSAMLIELNADYVKLIEKRCKVNLPLIFEEVA